MATTASGVIREYHFNSQVLGRGVCIKMSPSIPSPDGWVYLCKSNALYQEITDLLREGYLLNNTCLVTWSAYQAIYLAINYTSLYK